MKQLAKNVRLIVQDWRGKEENGTLSKLLLNKTIGRNLKYKPLYVDGKLYSNLSTVSDIFSVKLPI